MSIPSHTRILLIADDERSTREYGIGRSMVVGLIMLGLIFAGLFTMLLVSFALQTREVSELRRVTQSLNDARREARQVRELRYELERMRTFQERLLTMLGVEPESAAASDSLAASVTVGDAGTAATLRRAAAMVMAPAPDLWPARGFVTREFTEGAPARGIVAHPGIDIAGPRDSPIVSAGDGVVFRTGTDPYLGNFVEIQHGLGYLTVYGHCSRIAVARSDRVQRGQVVAYLGDTGQASAPHVHFEIWRDGEAIDPRAMLEGDPPQQ
jgi:murein DD-endopeptidase MepM/ murein hydrolase activator NlpD